jgi:hypothetical protein
MFVNFSIKMMVESLNMLFLFFFLILFSILINTNTSLHLLLTAELLWITLYTIVLFIGFIFDNLNVLSLTFFFLVFSAIEFGLGLVLLLFQNIITRSINLNDYDNNFLKFSNRFKNKLYINKINWKY